MKRESPFCRPVRTSLTHLPTWGTARDHVLVMYLSVASADHAVAEEYRKLRVRYLREYVITLRLVEGRERKT